LYPKILPLKDAAPRHQGSHQNALNIGTIGAFFGSNEAVHQTLWVLSFGSSALGPQHLSRSTSSILVHDLGPKHKNCLSSLFARVFSEPVCICFEINLPSLQKLWGFRLNEN
jgi:hypothetical protein